MMSWFQAITMDEILFAIILTGIMREAMIWTLPDRVAGPGGWLIDTGKE